MSLLSNAHTHTTYCDGKTPMPQMVQAAVELGFVSLGLSGHAHQGFDPDYSMATDTQAAYFAHGRALQRSCRDLRLWVGLELDAMADEPSRRMAFEQADFIIGSAHYLCSDYRGVPIAVDGDPAYLQRYVDDVFCGDGLAMAKAYFDMEVEALLRDRPHIIGHFDLVRKYAGELLLFSEDSAAYQKIALDALQRAFACGGVLEVNTGGMARGFLKTPYPTLPLLCAWREMGGRVTVTSDCHDARYLAFAHDAALALLKTAGFATVCRLGTGDDLWQEIAL